MRKLWPLLAMLCVFLAPATLHGQTKTLTSSACFSDPAGNCLANGYLVFRLNVGAKFISNGQIVPAVNITINLDSTGKVAANQSIAANDSLQPTGTYYIVEVHNASDSRVRGPENWVLAGASPIDLAKITSSVALPDPGLSNPILSNPVAAQQITGFGLTLTASAPLTVGAQVTSTVATGTAPFSIASTTVVPNLNAQLHNGLTAPASAIVGISDTQALTNKTLDISANTLKTATNTAGHVPRNNGTQYVDAQLGFADLSGTASTSQIGTGTPAAGQYVDGGTGAWTAIPATGASEFTLSTGSFAVSWTVACTAGSTGHCAYTTIAKAHTLVRITYDLTQAPLSCATNAVVGVRDVTSSSNLSTITVNQGSTGYVDSGALSVAMTAGHEFLVGVITAAATCTTVPNGHSIVAVFQ